MNIGIIGTSRITHDHIKVLKKHNHNIVFLSSTRKKSKNLRMLSKKHSIKKIFFDWRKSIKYAAQYKNCNFLITSRIEDNFKILQSCVKLNRYILIEKPVFIKSTNFNYFKKNKKIFVGFNRIFYKNINFLKKKLKDKKNVNAIVRCPETNKKNIIKNSCHIISILKFIFGNLKLDTVKRSKDFINCTLSNKKKFSCFITFNFKNSDNFSIEVFYKKYRFFLSPIENLKIFKKIQIRKKKNNFFYQPIVSRTLNEYEKNFFKPGFEEQLKSFSSFTKGKKIINDLEFTKKIVKTCEKILG